MGIKLFFFQKFGAITGGNLIQLVLNVLKGREFPTELNETLLILIPKIPNPQSITQLRPIGLCNVAYKTIAKNRLKLVMETLVAPTQCIFIPGMQITDNIIIVQEMLHTMRWKSGETGYMAIKIDLEKAYDRLRWPFIRETLLEENLPQIMVDTIMNCLSLVNFTVMWNGAKTQAFTPSRGVRQGDPLSPYLFVLCIERLNYLIENMVTNGAWKPVYASRGGPPLSNLFFVDDLILFGEATMEQAKVIKHCLELFCSASG